MVALLLSNSSVARSVGVIIVVFFSPFILPTIKHLSARSYNLAEVVMHFQNQSAVQSDIVEHRYESLC